ncbi:hypothetical protein GCM10012290_02250 [Halolactibacillus alkaliphilus]|uniref:Uncharacterized protein n=1 Tax=Halolactibacillus alkaliphilus TaxID=442899 RepID=A0A511X0D2_9BACI|nr:hypothetical protein HAL01_08710 [Halolactibacillus alkaliphilus]GGN64588.1 hypothetical protein GCM10012290_02250 [Halolactibacillus alkaliphilus]
MCFIIHRLIARKTFRSLYRWREVFYTECPIIKGLNAKNGDFSDILIYEDMKKGAFKWRILKSSGITL